MDGFCITRGMTNVIRQGCYTGATVFYYPVRNLWTDPDLWLIIFSGIFHEDSRNAGSE